MSQTSDETGGAGGEPVVLPAEMPGQSMQLGWLADFIVGIAIAFAGLVFIPYAGPFLAAIAFGLWYGWRGYESVMLFARFMAATFVGVALVALLDTQAAVFYLLYPIILSLGFAVPVIGLVLMGCLSLGHAVGSRAPFHL